ncbi:MAG: Spy/CpxP family protein refolding chaperone [Chitinispirillaceae bacterium]|nr:Spy/CpxP family protein refolding chaperone [Chitinispirillaceae bacterium]
MNVRTALTTGLTLVFLGTAAFAQKGPGSGGPGCFWKDMKLTTQQQENLKTLHDQMQETRKKHKNEVKTVRKKISDELLKDTPSTADLDTYSRELGDIHVRMTQERYNHLLKVKQVLTTEQFKMMISREDCKKHYRHKGKMGSPNGPDRKHAGGCHKGGGAKSCGQKGTVE